jgi:hypothetical protein
MNHSYISSCKGRKKMSYSSIRTGERKLLSGSSKIEASRLAVSSFLPTFAMALRSWGLARKWRQASARAEPTSSQAVPPSVLLVLARGACGATNLTPGEKYACSSSAYDSGDDDGDDGGDENDDGGKDDGEDDKAATSAITNLPLWGHSRGTSNMTIKGRREVGGGGWSENIITTRFDDTTCRCSKYCKSEHFHPLVMCLSDATFGSTYDLFSVTPCEKMTQARNLPFPCESSSTQNSINKEMMCWRER